MILPKMKSDIVINQSGVRSVFEENIKDDKSSVSFYSNNFSVATSNY